MNYTLSQANQQQPQQHQAILYQPRQYTLPPPLSHTNTNSQQKYSIEMMNVGDASGASTAANPVAWSHRGVGSDRHLQSVVAVTADQHQALSSSSPAAATSKMSDVLKRKNAPKRKSQISSRSKTRNQDSHGETSSSATSSSVVQEFFNKATALGKCD